MNARQTKGFQIAKQKQVKEVKGGWLVKSQSTQGFYRVSEDFICDCPDSELHNETCKHAYAVRYYLDIEKRKPEGIQNERIRLTYAQAWSAYNQAQTQEGRLFDELLKDLTYNIVSREDLQMRGRPRLLIRDQLFVAIKKIYSQMSSRRSVSLFKNAEEKGQITHTPHFNTVFNFLNNPKTTPILHQLIAITSAPLKEVETKFAVDSTGFGTRCFGNYCEGKYPSNRERKWLKLHACVGTKTHIITSAVITDENGADSPQFIPLTEDASKNGFKIEKLFADKGYLSRDNLDFVDKLGGTAYIPFKQNSIGKSMGSSTWRRMYFYFKMNQEEFMRNYNQRSNVESVFSAMKKKLGETLKQKTHIGQVNELLCKVVAYNIMVLIEEMQELGINPDFALKSGL